MKGIASIYHQYARPSRRELKLRERFAARQRERLPRGPRRGSK
ncbi:MAG: hypothetical protein AB7O62_08545 [Pirellulales bacterium]